MVRSQIANRKPTFYSTVIVMFGLSVIVCEILVFNLPKWSQSVTVKVMSYNVAEYVIGWHFMSNTMVENLVSSGQPARHTDERTHITHICSSNMHYLYLDLSNGPRSNVIIPIESQ